MGVEYQYCKPKRTINVSCPLRRILTCSKIANSVEQILSQIYCLSISGDQLVSRGGSYARYPYPKSNDIPRLVLSDIHFETEEVANIYFYILRNPLKCMWRNQLCFLFKHKSYCAFCDTHFYMYVSYSPSTFWKILYFEHPHFCFFLITKRR